MRDGQSLLEQVLSCCGAELTAEQLHRLLGTASGKRFEQLVAGLVERDAARAIAELDGAVSEGVDVGQLLEQLLGYFRDVMVAGIGCSADSFLHATSGDEARVKTAATQLGLENVLAVMQIIDHTLGRMRLSTHARTLAEVAIVRICSLENLEDLSTLVAAVRSGAVSSAPSTASRIAPPVRPAAAAYSSSGDGGQKKNLSEAGAVGNAAAHESNGDQSHELSAQRDETQTDAESPAAVNAAEPIELTSENVTALWQQALDGLSNMASDQAGLADSVLLAGPRRVVVRFPRKYQSCKLYCERPEQAAMLQRRLMEIVGPPVQIEFVVDESIVEAAPTQRAAPPRPRTAERAQQPFVKKAMELFGASSIRVEEPPG